MSQLNEFDDTDLSSVNVAICGGAPVPEPLMKRYAGVGVPFFQGYGLTETSPSLTVLTKDFTDAKLGSAGRPVFFVDMKLVAEDGSEVTEPFATGEICARGPNIMKGYWNRPDATAEAVDADGWFHTGDAGHVDEDGFWYVVDRVKDMVISGGENVYPAEVEEVLLAHPAIGEVAVVGTPSERWGEAVCAVVMLSGTDTVTLEELREAAGESLARYKLPTRLEVVDEIPHNASGKMLKRELRVRFDTE
jgi:fatty-acyl-CoA synthase